MALAVLWPSLPARIPTHWGVSGQVDGWSGRAFGALLLPVMSVAAYLLLLFLPTFDPRMKKGVEGNSLAVLGIVRLAMVALLTFMFGVQMAVALGVPIDSGRLIINGLLVFFLVMGNFFGSLRPNYFVGIRTPWTLESPATWRATHRVGGRIMVLGSLLLMALQFVVPNISAAFLVFVLGLAVWSMVYSWSYHRTHAAG